MGTEIVDSKTGELSIFEEQSPKDLLLRAKGAAMALEEVIKSNSKAPMIFNGKRYLEYSHWQTIATFYHVTVATKEAEYVKIGETEGFRARAEVIDQGTGLVVGTGDAYCMRDEVNWKSKPLFQLASMAQTRAGCKALSNKYRYVAIVAGYDPTPGEEVQDMKSDIAMPKEKIHAIPALAQPQPAIEFGGPQQTPEDMDFTEQEKKSESKFFKKLHAVAREKGLDKEKMKTSIKVLFNKESSKDLTDAECATLITQIEKNAIRNA